MKYPQVITLCEKGAHGSGSGSESVRKSDLPNPQEEEENAKAYAVKQICKRDLLLLT